MSGGRRAKKMKKTSLNSSFVWTKQTRKNEGEEKKPYGYTDLLHAEFSPFKRAFRGENEIRAAVR